MKSNTRNTNITFLHSYNVPGQGKGAGVEAQIANLRPQNAFLKATGLNLPAAYPKEALHQFPLGLYGEYVLPATLSAATLYYKICYQKLQLGISYQKLARVLFQRPLVASASARIFGPSGIILQGCLFRLR